MIYSLHFTEHVYKKDFANLACVIFGNFNRKTSLSIRIDNRFCVISLSIKIDNFVKSP